MAIKIQFSPTHTPEIPTLILAKKNGEVLGQLDSKSVVVRDSLNNASEITFSVKKYVDGVKTPLWDKIVDFKLLRCVEWDMWFEITVDISESIEVTKDIYCTELSQAELSQILLFDNEYNTETDIAREDYKNPSVLYKPNALSESILHRMLEKAPHYTIIHVDSTIANIQRTFSFDNISIYDAFTQVGEEINCLFVYHSNTDSNGNIVRGISVYDLESNCIACGHRGEFTGVCPKCGSTNITEGYGNDTTIFITAEELASSIQLSTDTGSVKNCFKLEGGDDLMTATIRNCNPNGSDYMWYISKSLKEDMSDELVAKIDSYDMLYEMYQKDYKYSLNASKVSDYNAIIKKYKVYDDKLEEIANPVISYPSLMNVYYNIIDLALYLESSLMPDAKLSDTNAKEQLALLTYKNLSPVAVTDISYMSSATADNVVMQMARAYVDSRYKLEILSSSLQKNAADYTWTGVFQVTNYSDSDDTATGEEVSVIINADYESYIRQKINVALHDKDTTDLSITGLFSMTDTKFKEELTKYALNCLLSFQTACQSCIDILIEQGISTSSTWVGQTPNMYDEVYVPYYNKLQYIEAEIKVRENEIKTIKGVTDEDGNITVKGLQTYIEDLVNQTQKSLDFQSYIGENLWKEFITYRRESKYSNSNYVSDGLNNAELFAKAREFIEVAEKEIYKSAERQHSITSTLKNLLMMKKFEPLIDNFSVGNWLRIEIDDTIYKLRLLKYEIDYDNLENISVEFSDVFKTMDGNTDYQSLISQTIQMTTSYSGTQRQASQGAKSQETVKAWKQDGIDSATTKIINENTNGQRQIWDEHGMLFKRYNSYTETFDSIQMKIINSTLAITDDNWKTTKTALGLFKYQDPRDGKTKEAYGINGEMIIGKLLIGEGLGIYNESASLCFDNDGLEITSKDVFFVVNPNSSLLFKIGNADGNALTFNDEGDLVIVGNITAKSLTLLTEATVNANKVNGLSDVAVSGDYNDLLNKPTIINFSGSYNDLSDKPLLSAVALSGKYSDLKGVPNLSVVATSGSYNDLSDKPTIDNFSGSYNDLSDKPKLAVVATSGLYSDLVDAPELSVVAISGLYSDLTGTPTLSDVAKSGSYNDLSDKPLLSAVALSGKYSDLKGVPNLDDLGNVDISGKFDNPINQAEAIAGMILVKTETGSEWRLKESDMSIDLTNYLTKQQSLDDAGKIMYINETGVIAFITVDDLKILLGLTQNTENNSGENIASGGENGNNNNEESGV